MYKLARQVEEHFEEKVDEDDSGYRPSSGTKIGGYINWCQGVEYHDWYFISFLQFLINILNCDAQPDVLEANEAHLPPDGGGRCLSFWLGGRWYTIVPNFVILILLFIYLIMNRNGDCCGLRGAHGPARSLLGLLLSFFRRTEREVFAKQRQSTTKPPHSNGNDSSSIEKLSEVPQMIVILKIDIRRLGLQSISREYIRKEDTPRIFAGSA